MDAMQTLSQNSEFISGAYNMGALMSWLLVFVLIDTALKGWGMWRAARMEKKGWFIALLLINSLGIFPVIFLLSTNRQYKEFLKEGNS